MDNRAWDQGWCSTLAIASLLMGGIACSGPKVTTETSKELPRYQIRTEGCESPRTICFDDTTMTEHQSGLLAYVQRHAKPRPPR